MPTRQASLREVMDFVEREKRYRLGCEYVDLDLVSSTLLTPGVELWTLDRRLVALAERFKVGHRSVRR